MFHMVGSVCFTKPLFQLSTGLICLLTNALLLNLNLDEKKILFTVLYRSPASKQGSQEFEFFLTNFKNLHANIMAENPYATFFTGDFNGHSQFWWPEGDTNAEGREIEDLLTSL